MKKPAINNPPITAVKNFLLIWDTALEFEKNRMLNNRVHRHCSLYLRQRTMLYNTLELKTSGVCLRVHPVRLGCLFGFWCNVCFEQLAKSEVFNNLTTKGLFRMAPDEEC